MILQGKVVPNERPNDDGEWVPFSEVHSELIDSQPNFIAKIELATDLVPFGFHVVALEVKRD